ncbi:hypothetical protein DIS24_g4637 [Lasiodiplodia hormozganensis]|uniref:Telomere-associated protein Rif1 N-terminal domain-containing protein n=1 Tax=Lasiodiplodia hormozganensis TaxID=869390 RepID=A0AA39YV96_9PEZI|nr:hypothetical protein DIS24_g4637 [Lasiodiplodia hormozganensis]
MAPASPNLFESLPARPPTPPREADKYIDDALQFLSDSFEVEEATGDAPVSADPTCVNTPTRQSPASSTDRANDSGRRKKVDFSPWTAYHSVNDIAPSRRGLPGSPLRPLPQPRDPKTIKGILKAHDPPVTQPSTPTSGQLSNNPNGFATMMETLVKQLAGQSRPHRIDAYLALANTLKTYDGKPDARTLADKMGLLAQFMQRDMTATNAQTGGLDVQLALQALKLLVALMEIAPAAERIPDTFRTFFLDKAIETFGDATAPKQWVNHILHAFSQQRFGKSMNVDRANRAVTALKDIEDRVSGNNVVTCRMMAYRTLLSQHKLVMIDRALDWIQHIFHGLLSSNKEIRMRAVELGTATGISVGKEDDKSKVSRTTMDILAKPIEDGQTYGDYFTNQLMEMLSDAEAAHHVPHIWATVVLLLKNRRHKLESWKLLKSWLQVFQKCVNSSNKEVAIQANGAWNRFVYAIRPTQSTSPPFRKLLRQALVAQFDRRSGGDKDGQRMKRSAFSSYCNLLYYSLSPTAPAEQLDLYWQEFVVEVLPTMIKKDRRGAVMACKVLTALFKRNRAKLWRENLAVESATITLDNIIALDPRWTRQRLGNVLQPFELCFASAPWTCNSPSEEVASGTPVKSMWTALMGTVAEAGSKEVTASMDFKEACAHIMNLLHRLWANYPKSFRQDDDSGPTWMEKFAFVVLTAVEQLGPGSFADPILSPTDRSSQSLGEEYSSVFEILAGGLNYGTEENLNVAASLYEAFVARIQREVSDGAGIAAVVLAITEPLAERLQSPTFNSNGDAVYALWNTVMTLVERIPRHDNMLLKALEALITAGLRSERQRIVNRTIEMWNGSFGSQINLQYPPSVEKGLRRLRPIVDLELPEFPDDPSDEEPEPVPIFEDSQEDIVREPLQFDSHGSSLIHQLQDAASSSPAEVDPTSRRRVRESSASNTTARAKLRHDNSQIDFAPIESSPTGGDSVDSQLLTDHQREVRERQHDTAAMFPDISSSPPRQLKSRSLELPAYGRPSQGYNVDDEEPRSTPMFNLQEYGAQQDVPSSSPTPKTRKQGHADDVLVAPYVTSSAAEHLFDTNIPSSPPSVDDENDLPADPSVIKDSFVAPNRNVESAMGQRYGGLEEELDEDVVAQLVGDVSNLSDSRVDKAQRPTSSSSASDDGNESDLPSSEIDEEVSQQLENEVIAQALRESRTWSSTRKQVLPDDTTVDEDIPEYDEDIGSFDDMTMDLPQGTAGSFSETVRNRIHVDEVQDELSPTEKDSSSIELPIRCSPGKTRSLPPPALSKAPVDETMVEDSFAGLHNDLKKSTQAKQQTPKSSGKSNKKQSKSHTKRKSLTTLDEIKAKKRLKKDDPSSSKQPPEGAQRATIDSDSDESALSAHKGSTRTKLGTKAQEGCEAHRTGISVPKGFPKIVRSST